jgi:LysW-gamma-L-alpha-aminoadipyl-6-phosphate/LysW-L-glutamyl-5-phosphate reductase
VSARPVVSVVGGGGYIGGELARLLAQHPGVRLGQVTSSRYAGRPLHAAHPVLRGVSDLRFVCDEDVEPCDVLFLALPHGVAMRSIDRWAGLAPMIVDLSADFRLPDRVAYERWYRVPGPDPAWLARFVPGIPEIGRERLRTATHISVPGCMSNAAILALRPVADAGLIDGDVVVDARMGSSGGGHEPDAGSHHPERSGVMRVFKPIGHRHTGEIEAHCRVRAHMSATAVEAVRGVQVLCHAPLAQSLEDGDLWSVYRHAYGREPFVRLVRQRTGLYRLPEPKILIGTNFCDVGFARSEDGRHVVTLAALDNLVKGGAGNAVQCLNIARGWDEREGLRFPGLHPV